MAACYLCDYNKIPFEEMIKLIWGDSYSYSNFARNKYLSHEYIFLTNSGKVYGLTFNEVGSWDTIIKTSTLMKDIKVGKL